MDKWRRFDWQQWRGRALGFALGAAAGALLLVGLRCLGVLFILAIRDRPVGEMLPAFGALLGGALGIVAVAFARDRIGGGRGRAIAFGLGLAACVGVAWIASVHGAPEGTPFGAVVALEPGEFWEDTPSRPRIHY